MKATRIYTLLTLLLTSIPILAQERAIVQGFCKDENGKAIENVSVYVRDSMLVSVTDEKGRFTYGHAQAGDQLRFVHTTAYCISFIRRASTTGKRCIR